jgi:hypothetical protein
MELIVWLPEVALAPDQAPEAEQEVALAEDQVSIEDPPLVTVAGFATSAAVTIGAGGDPGGGVFPPLTGASLPPPQAAKPNAHSNANDAP